MIQITIITLRYKWKVRDYYKCRIFQAFYISLTSLEQPTTQMELLKQAIFFVALATFASSQTHDPNYCFVTDPIRRQISMFSSRTAYEIQRGGTINAQVSCEYE